MRSAMLVALLLALPSASALEVRTEAGTPVRLAVVDGLTTMASTLLNDPQPCNGPPANDLCQYVLGVAQDMLDAAECIHNGYSIPECLQKLSGVFCLTFKVGAMEFGIQALNLDKRIVDVKVVGAGVEFQAGPSVLNIDSERAGLGTFRFTTSTAAECNS